MKSFSITKIANYIIYLLFLILFFLLSYNIYILFNKLISPKSPPKNSIRVSPLNGETLNVDNYNQIIKVKYNNTDITKLPSITNSDIVFEEYNVNSYEKSYSALFNTNTFKLDDSMSLVTYESASTIPQLKFVSKDNLLNFSNHHNNIILKFNSNNEITIKFTNSKYNVENIPVDFDNIIIKSTTQNYIFTTGLVRQINPSSDLTIIKGKTYILNIATNYSIKY
ncbi:MAG: hypothetical protein ACRC7N_07220 [Clostridium sp.]